MKENFTRNSLVRYLYKEVSLSESLDITSILSTDEEIRNEFDNMAEMKNELDSISFNPSDSCLNKILTFSLDQMITA